MSMAIVVCLLRIFMVAGSGNAVSRCAEGSSADPTTLLQGRVDFNEAASNTEATNSEETDAEATEDVEDVAAEEQLPAGYQSLGSNTNCRGVKQDCPLFRDCAANLHFDIQAEDGNWPKAISTQTTLAGCASACDKEFLCSAMEFDGHACTLFGHGYVVSQSQAGVTCYTSAKAYDRASDIYANTYETKMHDMYEKWGKRDKSTRATKFAVGDSLIVCNKPGHDACGSTLLEVCDLQYHEHHDASYCLEPVKVVEVVGCGKYMVDFQNGLAAILDFDFTEAGGAEAILDGKAVAEKCTAHQFSLDVPGRVSQCVEECPPGYLDGAGVCKRCYGTTDRRRATTCRPCKGGHVSKMDSDRCQNLQDTCNQEQCGPCKECIKLLSPTITKCAKESATKCYDPGNSWCAGAQEGLMRCQSKSMGCFYKLVCQADCVCSSWKKIFCGGKEGQESCNRFSGLIQNESFPGKQQDGADSSVSLEESLAGKRTCR